MELYVHIPFCIQKCRYCSFTSYAAKGTSYASYIDLLLKEAESRVHEMTEPVSSVYIGGGTPSLLSPDLFRKLTVGLKAVFGFDHVIEFSSEANPGTVTPEWLETAVSAGVNRLSFGMQAFQENLLRTLGRIHHFDEVCSSVLAARKAGIRNLNLDLMFGIPGQCIRDWDETLEAALELNPEHISAYGLIPEEGTPLFDDLEAGRVSLPDPEEERDMYSLAVGKLAGHGFQQYEISNFARTGFECRHNIGYWKQIPYIGLGVSAASMTDVLYSPGGMKYIRRTNPSSLDEYREMLQLPGNKNRTELVTASEARFETMMLGLRMNEGVSEEAFFRMHGMTIDSCYGSRLILLESKGLLIHDNGRWRLTARGFDIQNSVLVELMDD